MSPFIAIDFKENNFHFNLEKRTCEMMDAAFQHPNVFMSSNHNALYDVQNRKKYKNEVSTCCCDAVGNAQLIFSPAAKY